MSAKIQLTDDEFEELYEAGFSRAEAALKSGNADLLWRESCSANIRERPKKCPRCGARVVVVHLNEVTNDACYKCESVKCVWPVDVLRTEKWVGKSDYFLFQAVKKELENEKAKKRKRKRSEREDQLQQQSKSEHSRDGDQQQQQQQEQSESEQRLGDQQQEQSKREQRHGNQQQQQQEKSKSDQHLEDQQQQQQQQRQEKSESEQRHGEQHQQQQQQHNSSKQDDPAFKVPSLPPGASPRRSIMKDPLALESSSSSSSSLLYSPSHALSPWHMPQMSPIPGLISPLRRSEFSDSDSEAAGLTPRRVQPDSEFRLTPGRDPQDDLEFAPKSPVKMTLKRTPTVNLKPSEKATWNVQQQQQQQQQQLEEQETTVNNKKEKLDKVLLSLKKNKNTWNVKEKIASDSASACKSGNKQQKRSRKSEKGLIKKVEKKAEAEEEFVLPTKSAAEKSPHLRGSPRAEKSQHSAEKSADSNNKKKAKRTYSRANQSKDEKTPSPDKGKVLQSLQNSLMFSTGITGISLDIQGSTATESPETPPSTETELNTAFSPAKLTNVINSAADFDDENREFRSLIRKMTSSDNSMDSLLKIQKSLHLHEPQKRISLHVGQRKATIDLPKDTLDVNEKLTFDSQSDGIESSVLTEARPRLPLNLREQRSRGRPRKRPPSPSPTMVPRQGKAPADQQGPYRYVEEEREIAAPIQPPTAAYHQQQIAYFQYFCNPDNLQMFKRTINDLMTGFEMRWSDERIDPVIAMLFQRRMEGTNAQHFSALDKIAEMYASFVQFEYFQQQQQQQQQLQMQQQTEPVNLSAPANNAAVAGPTYTELQTVRGKDTANDVLRQHQEQQQQQQHEEKDDDDDEEGEEEETSHSSPASTSSKRIKTEVMELPSSYPGIHSVQSVQMTSVYPAADASVREIDAAADARSADGIVGVGDRICTVNVGSSTIQVRCRADEVRPISDLVQEKKLEMESRGKSYANTPQFSTAALIARSKLRKEVVAYLDRAFTKKGMKENVMGRKKKNYPKRSQIKRISKNPIKTESIDPDEPDSNKTSTTASTSSPSKAAAAAAAAKTVKESTRDILQQSIDLDPVTSQESTTFTLPFTFEEQVNFERQLQETRKSSTCSKKASKKRTKPTTASTVKQQATAPSKDKAAPSPSVNNAATNVANNKSKRLENSVPFAENMNSFQAFQGFKSKKSQSKITAAILQKEEKLPKEAKKSDSKKADESPKTSTIDVPHHTRRQSVLLKAAATPQIELAPATKISTEMASVAGVSESAAFVRSKKMEGIIKKTLMKKEKKLKKRSNKKGQKDKSKTEEKSPEKKRPVTIVSEERKKDMDVLDELFNIAAELDIQKVPHQPPQQQQQQQLQQQQSHPDIVFEQPSAFDEFKVHSLEDLMDE